MCERLLLLLVISLTSCGSAQTRLSSGQEAPTNQSPLAQPVASPAQEQTVLVGKFKLTLNGCQLAYEGLGKKGQFAFEFPGPCQFSRDREGKIRVVKTGKTKTLLVESSRAVELPTGTLTKNCLTNVRGVIVSSRDIRLSVQTQKVAQCLPAIWDEKMFHIFAARTQPF